MKIKRYFAKDMRTALTQVKEELGPEAVIMSNKKTATGVEIVAAIDADAQPQPKSPALAQNTPVANSASAPNAHQFDGPNAEGAAKIASSLEELLKRQRADSAGTPSNTYQPNSVPQVAAANNDLSNQQKSELATQALSQQAESEFEQWLNRARNTVQDQSEQINTNQVAPVAAPQNNVSQINEQPNNISGHNVIQGQFDKQMSDLKDEMNSIKELLKHQVSELMLQDANRKSPVKAMLVKKLNNMGLSSNVAEHLSHFISDDLEAQQAWPKMLELLTEQLNTTDNEIIKRGGVYSLVGPTGVGKTTTIAKLAARFAQIHGADKVGLITTDSFRIGALEQLGTYAKILGCPLKQAKNTEELSEAIYQLRDKKLLLIDTAGMSQRDIKLTERLNHLLTKSRVNIKNYLVLSATSQMSVLHESVQHFKTIPLSGCIFTKIDESLSLGELISVAIHNRLPIGYLTNGQRVPEDIRVANGQKIVQKANQLYELKEKVSNKNNKVVPKAVGMYD
ncbi:flagellar biosynthesis protein FlhF [Psychrosphaera haliotis]|uniref:flagellar biosynthesis protein FlhF n=1 Tax=Psychrosphaera haliotis TaxID=555083 RepID=UPI0031D97106